jgi:YesN/AraC family two-component response regulator
MPDKLLLVDDDREFREEFAESLSDYEVIQADSGQEALKILARPNEIDLVIMDVFMPGLSGTEVLKQIRDNLPGLGIIILTGYSSKDIAIEALKGHADDYLEKPVDVEKAKEIIENILSAKRSPGGESSQGIKGKIEKVKHFVERNCFKKVGLEDAARAVCLSPKYLSRIFEEVTGTRFTEYRLKVKITQAMGFLKKSGYNIDQIADKLGYKNTESFIRQFKKITGQTPTEYRKTDKKKNKK